MPPSSWDLHHFTADLFAPDPLKPAYEIPSARAIVQSCFLPPGFGPDLHLEQRKASGDAVEWVVGYLDLPLGIPAGYAPSEVYLATTDLTASAGPKSLVATLQDGLMLDHRDGRVELKAEPGPNTFVGRTARWSASLATNLVVRDRCCVAKIFFR